MRIYKTVRVPSVSFASAGAGGVVVGHKPACRPIDPRRGRPENARQARPAAKPDLTRPVRDRTA